MNSAWRFVNVSQKYNMELLLALRAKIAEGVKLNRHEKEEYATAKVRLQDCEHHLAGLEQ